MQILAQRALAFLRQRQADIGAQAAFVDFVEDHSADAAKLRIAEQAAGEQAVRDHLDHCVLGNLAIDPGRQTDALTEPLAQGLRHALRRHAGSNAAGLEHDDLAGQGFEAMDQAGQSERDTRRFTGPGRRAEDQTALRAQRVGNFRQQGFDRQSGHAYTLVVSLEVSQSRVFN